ncbi:alpha/beta hydrolase [Draconibacterium sp. IB214405]|uniref:alpha/beta hydrolase n=1 Tax=Draconibacterium sp. IB214405 TaxID=3097352 RepID=UPI002A0E5057|nr:alpha/beta hydrolase [Draconibacterium sp. IB214405]MDX8340617.1 alpha/beta hydrolase [Draconibacterium sp. IB214405]
MHKKLSLVVLSIFLLSFSFAQERYTTDLFDEIRVETVTYATKDGENLDMDIYLPQNDYEQERATIIYVHGGGFSGGERDGENIKTFCTRLANYGYVVASISYRLTRKGKPEGFGCDCPATEKMNTIYAASEDLQDAAFFLIENRHQYAINPQQIILSGSSAGAETVLFTAYQPPYCYGLDSGPVSFAGVIGMAGAIPDTTALYDESAIPSLLFHGTDDNLVPYGTAPHHYCSEDSKGYWILHGSYTIAEKLEELEVPYWLHTTCGGAHEVNITPITDYFDVIIEFCDQFAIEKNGDQRQTIIEGKQNTDKYTTYNFCSE